MKKIAIIGAGPIGLYLAINLYKKGFKDIVIYDPRAEKYTRPGILAEDSFLHAKGVINDFQFTPAPGKFNHIKDMERELWRVAQKLNIPIEKKSFSNFPTSAGQKGIMVKAKDSSPREFVSSDYVFDCSGRGRHVVNAVNHFRPSASPFTLTPVSNNVKVKNHCIAYVEMKIEDFNLFKRKIAVMQKAIRDNKSTQLPDNYVKAIEQLRSLGWEHFSFPSCSGEHFGKNKVCLYLEAPDTLPEEKHKLWVESVLQGITASDKLHVNTLPPSKKYNDKPKPRLGTFEVVPQGLNKPMYTNDNRLPDIFVHGDALQEPNYVLSHGILSGFKRIDTMMDNMQLVNGQLKFNQEKYATDVNALLKAQREEIIQHYNKRSDQLSRGSACYHQLKNKNEALPKSIEKVRKEIMDNYSLKVDKIGNIRDEASKEPSRLSRSEKKFMDRSCNKLIAEIKQGRSHPMPELKQQEIDVKIVRYLNHMLEKAHKIPRTSGLRGFINDVFKALGWEKPFHVTSSATIATVKEMKAQLTTIKEQEEVPAHPTVRPT